MIKRKENPLVEWEKKGELTKESRANCRRELRDSLGFNGSLVLEMTDTELADAMEIAEVDDLEGYMNQYIAGKYGY